ncbi:Uncharacterised protein [Segatella copri]|nr:Uncharacterised protein [Segatella copri]
MINLTLRNAVDFSTYQTQAPAKIYLFIMSKETAV